MSSDRPIRADADRFVQLLTQRQMTQLWHFAPLSHTPCILFHGAVFSIEELDRRGLAVPGRESREADIAVGIGNVVKTSTQAYWAMLSGKMREGIPHVLFRFMADPVLWADTTFGDRNVWETGWTRGNNYDFAEQRIFVRKGQYAGDSPPEIYIERELPLRPHVKSLYTYLGDETSLLGNCLQRVGIGSPVRLMTAGEGKRPFPDHCHGDYISNRGDHLEIVRQYFATLSIESLQRGVEIDL